MTKLLWVAIVWVAIIPMRLTVIAPAEIVGRNAMLIAAPQDGVIARFFVEPNQIVAKGAPLFALKAQLGEQTAEVQYLKDPLGRMQVNAPEAGIAIFSDENDWLGKPVHAGECIILLADPAKVQIAIRVPADGALHLEPGADVKLYLDVAPLLVVAGVLTQSSDEPTSTSEGVLAYSLMADLVSGEPVQRIGLKGKAKLYSGWAPVIYHLLREPLAVVRLALGL